MKIGDLVRVVQSKSDKLASPFVGRVGVIIESHYKTRFSNQQSFAIMAKGREIVIGANYLEVISESR